MVTIATTQNSQISRSLPSNVEQKLVKKSDDDELVWERVERKNENETRTSDSTPLNDIKTTPV